jgi:hypothetical protein
MTSVVQCQFAASRDQACCRVRRAQPTMIRTGPERAPATSEDGRGLRELVRELGLNPGDETARQAVLAMVESR